ncbi:MAG: hypothetical protein U5R46_06100 [Gammaproteobacteria bacterium]|nr:hypothetical protein [Gammaproteobacteria bacterium]
MVLDASVVINLNATGHSAAILDALPNRVLVVDEVRQEVERDSRNGRKDADIFAGLVASSQVEVVELGEAGMQQFTNLVSGPATETLDDGEAATITYALEQDLTVLIDERKANRICAERYTGLETACTVDVLAHESIDSLLGRETLAEAVFNALYYGRMRVPNQHLGWVVDLIGAERAGQCNSLPRSARST